MVVKRNGARCPCGRRGCVEAYAGRVAMEARARKLVKRGEHTDLFKIEERRGRTRLTSGDLGARAEKGDAMAVALLDRAVEALGAGIASALNLLDVEAVVIGGGLGTRLGEPYVDRIREATMPHLFTSDRPAVMGWPHSATSAARSARRSWSTRTFRRPLRSERGLVVPVRENVQMGVRHPPAVKAAHLLGKRSVGQTTLP